MVGKLKEQYQKLPRALRWVIPSLLVIGLGIMISIMVINKPESSTETVSDVKYATATRGSIIISASGSGTLVSKNEKNLSFGTGGEVTSVAVMVGDTVQVGDLLAVLEASDAEDSYTAARLAFLNLTSASAIASAEQSLENAKSALGSARSSLEYLISPTVLKWLLIVENEEKVLVETQAEAAVNPSDSATDAVTVATEKLTASQKSLQYAWSYWESDYVPAVFTETETDQRTGVETVVYYTDSNGNTWPVVNKPTDDAITLAKANYDLAQATVDELAIYLDAIRGKDIPSDATGANLAKLFEARKAMESAKEELEAVNLTAPISGTITAINIKAGDMVSSGTAAMTVSDISQPYYIEAYFDESDWGTIKTGNEAEVTFDILPDLTFQGSVTEVTPILVSGGGSKLVHCFITLTDLVGEDLPSGTAASVEVIGSRAENVILVPLEAIRQIGDNQYGVFTLVDGELEMRLVEVGISNDFKIEIRSGLSEGDFVSTGIMEIVE